jgi:hypothetical protein
VQLKGAAENSPARPEALSAEGKCRVNLTNKSTSRFSGTDPGFSECVRTRVQTTSPAPVGANENSPARPEALGAEGKCRVSVQNEPSPALAGRLRGAF